MGGSLWSAVDVVAAASLLVPASQRCGVQVSWVDPATGRTHEFNAAVVHVFRRNRELDVAVLQAMPTAGASHNLRL